MAMTIDRQALQTLLYCMLTCPCPVTEEAERALMRFFFENPRGSFELDEVLAVADQNPKPTPVHLFRNFFMDGPGNPQNARIERRDILRYFASHYHFDRAASFYDPLTVCPAASYLISHMLLPVTIQGTGPVVTAIWQWGSHTVTLRNNVLFPGLSEPGEQGRFAIHMGGIIAPLTDDEAQELDRRLADIPQLDFLTRESPEIDNDLLYRDRGHLATTLERIRRHMPI